MLKRFVAIPLAARTLSVLLLAAVLVTGLVIPAYAQDNQNVYVVQPGDNLYRISLKFNITPQELAQANGIVNPNLIYVGQKLIIPQHTAAGQPAAEGTRSLRRAGTPGVPPTVPPAVTVEVTSATAVATPVTGVPNTYTVKAGDSLVKIAAQFNTTVAVLLQLNNLPNPNIIYVGQVLILPSTATAASTMEATQAIATAATTAEVIEATTEVVTNVGATPTLSMPTLSPAEATTAAPTSEVVPIPTAEATAIATQKPSNTASNVGFNLGLEASFNANNISAVLDRVSDLGVTWVKIRVYWKDMEPQQGAIKWELLDPQIDGLAARGVKIMLTITRAPQWARPAEAAAEDGPAADANTYATFVSEVAKRYAGKVQAYEVWERPNVRREWNGRPLSAASYVEMLRLAYEAVKAVDPSLVVVSAGLAPTGFDDGLNAIADRTFLRQAYAAGLASYADALGAQPSGYGNPPDSTCCNAAPGVSGWFNDRTFYFKDTLDDYRQIMQQNNDAGAFIWVTGFGWGSYEGISDPASINQIFGFVEFTDQTEQAQYTARGIEIGRGLGYVGPMFLSNLNACEVVQPNTSDFALCYSSLLNISGQPRPVYEAVKAARK